MPDSNARPMLRTCWLRSPRTIRPPTAPHPKPRAETSMSVLPSDRLSTFEFRECLPKGGGCASSIGPRAPGQAISPRALRSRSRLAVRDLVRDPRLEDGSPPRPLQHADVATLHARERKAQREAESGPAASPSGARAVRAPEALEDPVSMLGRNTGPLVAHLQ